MARIAGIDLPRQKRIEVGLTYIYGIGRSTSNRILEQLNIDPDIKTDDFLFRLELAPNGEAFCHLDEVYQWTPSAYKRMLTQFGEIQKAFADNLYCVIPKGNTKTLKLVKMFGFYRTHETDDHILMRAG